MTTMHSSEATRTRYSRIVVSTVYSKSVLRVAAQATSDTFDLVDYFPSYEMVTANYAASSAFADDYRDVREEMVAYVMSVFLQHYCGIPTKRKVPRSPETVTVSASEEIANAICDEVNLDPRDN